MPQPNIGGVDRVIRADLGIAVALFAVFGVEFWSPVSLTLLAIGSYAMLTAVVGWCPEYGLLKVSTVGKGGKRRNAGIRRPGKASIRRQVGQNQQGQSQSG